MDLHVQGREGGEEPRAVLPEGLSGAETQKPMNVHGVKQSNGALV